MSSPNEAAAQSIAGFGRLRAFAARGYSKQVGVDRRARVIRGFAVMTRGEALGHDAWVDAIMLSQVVASGNAAPKGIKARFTHPGLCSDGIGKYLGRVRNFRLDGNVARGDLHLSEVSGLSPEATQDPAEYLMRLAESDPESFGASIVFWPDKAAMDLFKAEHQDEDGEFASPDEDNTHNLRHMRLAKLEACDVVGDPAANAGGFFSAGDEGAARAERVLCWLLGLGAPAPAPETLGGAAPERVQTFLAGFLARHGLEIVRRPIVEELDMSPDELKKHAEDAAQKARDETLARLKELKAAFPGDEPFAVACFEKGLDLAAAKAEHDSKLAETVSTKDAEIAALKAEVAKLQAENAGIKKNILEAGAAPLPQAPAPVKKSFSQIVADYKAEHKCSDTEAISVCALAHPELYEAVESGQA